MRSHEWWHMNDDRAIKLHTQRIEVHTLLNDVNPQPSVKHTNMSSKKKEDAFLEEFWG